MKGFGKEERGKKRRREREIKEWRQVRAHRGQGGVQEEVRGQGGQERNTNIITDC